MNSQKRAYFDGLALTPSDSEAEPLDEQETPCECCASKSRLISGYLHLKSGPTIAACFMHWTPGVSLETHPANFDLIIGPWGSDEARDWRCAVSLIRFDAGSGPGVMVIDAATRQSAHSDLAAIALQRDDVIGTPFAQSVFALFDAALQQDPRLAEFLSPG